MNKEQLNNEFKIQLNWILQNIESEDYVIALLINEEIGKILKKLIKIQKQQQNYE